MCSPDASLRPQAFASVRQRSQGRRIRMRFARFLPCARAEIVAFASFACCFAAQALEGCEFACHCDLGLRRGRFEVAVLLASRVQVFV